MAEPSYLHVLSEVDEDIERQKAAAEPPAPEPWPVLDTRALYGLAGDAARLACRNSEADPAAVLAQFICRFGATIGPEARVCIGDSTHFARLFVAVIGETAKARKGTSEKPVDRLFRVAEDRQDMRPLPVYRGGIGSGEGIVYAVRDPSERLDDDGQPIDPGLADKRLLVIDEELAGTLRAAAREGSTASAILRQAWDKGDLGTLTKQTPTRATGAHVGIIGHITAFELADVLAQREVHNGLANRFLWIGARRPQIVSWPKPMPEPAVQAIAAKLRQAILHASEAGELQPTGAAMALWDSIYAEIAATEIPGRVGAVTARAEAQIIRLALHYALLDQSAEIDAPHLAAAVSLWDYASATAAYIFGGDVEDSTEGAILAALKSGPKRLSDISSIFGRNIPAAQYRPIIQRLETAGRIERFKGERVNGGRAPTFFKIVEAPCQH